jgi:hypothetical protein
VGKIGLTNDTIFSTLQIATQAIHKFYLSSNIRGTKIRKKKKKIRPEDNFSIMAMSYFAIHNCTRNFVIWSNLFEEKKEKIN